METSIALERILIQYFQCSYNRIDFIARFVLSLIQVKDVNLTQIATSLNPDKSITTNYRRIQRFISGFSFECEMVLRFVLEHLPKQEELVLCLDRTNWKFGKLNINIMAITAAHRGTGFNLLWTLLAKQGNSNQAERISLIKKLLRFIPAPRIKALVADREFIGKDWFAFLVKKDITFHIRIRQNMLTDLNETGSHIFVLFAPLPPGEALTLHQPQFICGQWVKVTGMKLESGEYLIIVTNGNPKHSLTLYAQRWEIEMFFKAIKKTGFDFESTHLQDLERISTLLALVTIAFTWAHKLGEYLHDHVKPITIKKHGYLAQSFFRYGLDYLRSILNHYHCRFHDFLFSLTLLTCI